MRKLLMPLLLALLLPLGASANSWGLSNHILSVVMSTSAYDNWSAITECDNDRMAVAVMGRLPSERTRVILASYHQPYADGVWVDHCIGAAAVLQGYGDAGLPKASVGEDGESFVIAYPDVDERFTFSWTGSDGDELILSKVELGALTLHFDFDALCWSVWENGIDTGLVWRAGTIPAEQLDASLVPRTTEEVLHLNACYALLQDIAAAPATATGSEKKVPVYAAPSLSALRAANGKASVSLTQGVTLYGQYDGFDLVEYSISTIQNRIGMIAHGKLSSVNRDGVQQPAVDSLEAYLCRIPMTTSTATALTDDPHGTKAALWTLEQGTELIALGRMGAFYAYAAVSTDAGEAWAFVPMADLALPEVTVAEDVTQYLVGEWAFYAGGVECCDYVIFRADGTCQQLNMDLSMATNLDDFTHRPEVWQVRDTSTACWQVIDYQASQGKYWDSTKYELIFTRPDGTEYRFGLTCEPGIDYHGSLRDQFSLYIDQEGSGGYLRVTDSPGGTFDASIDTALDFDALFAGVDEAAGLSVGTELICQEEGWAVATLHESGEADEVGRAALLCMLSLQGEAWQVDFCSMPAVYFPDFVYEDYIGLLQAGENSFTMLVNGFQYTFTRCSRNESRVWYDGASWEEDFGWLLTEVQGYGGLRLALDERQSFYRVEGGGAVTEWAMPAVRLEWFNLAETPVYVEEVEQLNRAYAWIASNEGFCNAHLVGTSPVLQDDLSVQLSALLTEDPTATQHKTIVVPDGAELSFLEQFDPWYAWTCCRWAEQEVYGYLPLSALIVEK